MRKYILAITLILSCEAFSQNLPSSIKISQNIVNTCTNFAIQFDKKCYECENKWVFIPINAENRTYFVDYIFLDPKDGYSIYSGGIITFDNKYNIKSYISNDIKRSIVFKCSNFEKYYALIPADFLELINLQKDTPPQGFKMPKFENRFKHDLRVAQQLNELGENAKALLLLEKIQHQSPNDYGLILELAKAYNALQKYDEAVKIINPVLNKSKEDILFQNELAFAFYKRGEYDSALQIYNVIFDKIPETEKLKKHRISLIVSQIYMSKSEYDTAEKWIKKSYEYIRLPKDFENVSKLDSSYVDKDHRIVFKDGNLERNIKKILGKDSLSGVYLSDVENIRSIDISNRYKSSNSEKVRNIDALKFFVNLDSIKADYNLIRTIKPLSGLKKLKYLSFQNNSITDLTTLADLNELTNINFRQNFISNIWPLKNLRNLKQINFFSNLIDDITPLINLENIFELNLGMNRITSISYLKDKSTLRILWLFGNKIADPEVISTLPNLRVLSLAQCSIKEISFLSNCKNITSLMLFENEISDLKPLSELTKLEGLNLQKNKITDLSVIVELVRQNAFASNQRVFQFKLDVSDNLIDYSDNKNVENREFLKSQIQRSKF